LILSTANLNANNVISMAVVLQPHGDIKNLNVAAHIACQNGMYEKIERCQIEKLS
jgi:hypothetical protein